jgi:hypothetical protein
MKYLGKLPTARPDVVGDGCRLMVLFAAAHGGLMALR